MKRIIIFIAFSILMGMQSYSYDGRRERVSFGVFFDALQPYGEWINVSDFGYAWHPSGIDRHWRPYMNGRWVWSDYGWFWVSYEDWGWAPYHYGRWIYNDYYGWIWVPDYEWGPSWVQWRYADGYIGWAPLPPRAGFHFNIGIDVDDYGVPYFGWCFTAGYGFYSDHPGIFEVERNRHLIRMTHNVTDIRGSDRGVMNRGLDYRNVERMNRTRIRPVRIEDEREFTAGRGTRLEGDRVRVYRPEIRPETRNEIETRVRGKATPERPAERGRSSDFQRLPDNQGDRQRDERKINRENARPEVRGESQNRHPQPENQPRFNIPERKEEPRREVVPERRPAPAQTPQIERRRAEPQFPSERRSGGSEQRGSSGQRERSGDRRR